MSTAPTGPDWASLASADLLLSLRVPLGWDVETPDEARMRVYRDDPDDGGFRANVGFMMGAPEEPGPAWFERFSDAVPDQLAATVENFELVRSERFELSSGASVLQVTARADDSSVGATSTLQAYVWANSYRMYLVTGTTLRAHEQRDIPVFDAIVRSVRVLPPRRGAETGTA